MRCNDFKEGFSMVKSIPMFRLLQHLTTRNLLGFVETVDSHGWGDLFEAFCWRGKFMTSRTSFTPGTADKHNGRAFQVLRHNTRQRSFANTGRSLKRIKDCQIAAFYHVAQLAFFLPNVPGQRMYIRSGAHTFANGVLFNII